MRPPPPSSVPIRRVSEPSNFGKALKVELVGKHLKDGRYFYFSRIFLGHFY